MPCSFFRKISQNSPSLWLILRLSHHWLKLCLHILLLSARTILGTYCIVENIFRNSYLQLSNKRISYPTFTVSLGGLLLLTHFLWTGSMLYTIMKTFVVLVENFNTFDTFGVSFSFLNFIGMSEVIFNVEQFLFEIGLFSVI